MKRSWIILGLLLLLIALVVILYYAWDQGMITTLPTTLWAWLLIIAIIALIAGIAWLALWKPASKIYEPKVERAVGETRKEVVEPSLKAVKEGVYRGFKVIDIEGIGPVNAAKLNSAGIYTTSELLEAGATLAGRRKLAEKIGVSEELISGWVNCSDLFRIKGVAEEYSDLLAASGVTTVVDLAKRSPETLHAKMLDVNAREKLVRRTPTLTEVRQWVEDAKSLPRKVE